METSSTFRSSTSLPTFLFVSSCQLQLHYKSDHFIIPPFFPQRVAPIGVRPGPPAPPGPPTLRLFAPLTYVLLCCSGSPLHLLVSLLPPSSKHGDSSRSVSVLSQLSSYTCWRNQLSAWYQAPLMFLQITSLCNTGLAIHPFGWVFISTLTSCTCAPC